MVGFNPKKKRKGGKRHGKRRNPLAEMALAAGNPRRKGRRGGFSGVRRGVGGIDWAAILAGGAALVGGLYSIKVMPPQLQGKFTKYAPLLALPLIGRFVVKGKLGNAIAIGGIGAIVLHAANDFLLKGEIINPPLAFLTPGTTAGLGSYEVRGLGAGSDTDRSVEEVIKALGATPTEIPLGEMGTDGLGATADDSDDASVGSYEVRGLGEDGVRLY